MRAPSYDDLYDPDTDFDRHYSLLAARRIRRWLRPGDRVLEVGSAQGLMTEVLARRPGVRITAVERSERYARVAATRAASSVEVVHARVEEVEAAGRFHHVVATGVLGESEDPIALLAHLRRHLAPGGLLHLTVANRDSLHRLAAVAMGLLDSVEAPSERDELLGIRRALDLDGLRALCAEAGLALLHDEGILLKPFSNAQMAELPAPLIAGLDAIAHELPGRASTIYAIVAADLDEDDEDDET